ncbi:MAG TPA: hypothetical protein VJT75_17915 [Thermoleophilaceae bacterium]|nr:hypothetical protein [Thermoleophilaceae bacterium]
MRSKPSARRCAFGLIAALALIVPATAGADDQSVYNSFHFSHPRFQKLRQDFERGEQRWEDSGYQEPGDAYRACRRTASLSRKVRDKMQAKEVSSATGTKARASAVLGLKYRKRWADSERRAIEEFMAFDGEAYIRLHRNAREHIARAQKYEAEAQKLFKQAGVDTSPG